MSASHSVAHSYHKAISPVSMAATSGWLCDVADISRGFLLPIPINLGLGNADFFLFSAHNFLGYSKERLCSPSSTPSLNRSIISVHLEFGTISLKLSLGNKRILYSTTHISFFQKCIPFRILGGVEPRIFL
jgi:hypothetical protein